MNKCLYCYMELEKEKDFHAACCKKIFGTTTPPLLEYTIDEMAELARQVVETSVSVPGVQPKLSLGLIQHTITDKNQGRLTILGALGGNYILKPPNATFPEMPQNEHLTMKLAGLCSIATVPCSLIRLKSGELSYITKRIDRTEKGDKMHMLDMFQILEAFDKYRSSMEKVGKAITDYSTNTLLDVLRLYEIVVFCFITGNNDMHLKNFSLIKKNERWELSPAYDLLNVHLHLPEDTEESALTIGGKKKKLTKTDFTNLGLKLGLSEKQINNAFQRLIKNKSNIRHLIKKSFLSADNRKKYDHLVNKRIALFE